MLDRILRPIKDKAFYPLAVLVPRHVAPVHITMAGFVAGLLACQAIRDGDTSAAMKYWLINRFCDCLDGSVARLREETTEFGGFMDLLSDFIVYALIPLCCAETRKYRKVAEMREELMTVAYLEAAFFINNFVLFYIASVEAKAPPEEASKHLTSVRMPPGMIEGTESMIFFTLMILDPRTLRLLSFIMAMGVAFGTLQRVVRFARYCNSQRQALAKNRST